MKKMIIMTPACTTCVSNDKFVAGLTGLVRARLP